MTYNKYILTVSYFMVFYLFVNVIKLISYTLLKNVALMT